MAHLHTQIRNAIKAKVTSLATTGARVYANRLHPLRDADLPALLITCDTEAVELLTAHAPAMQLRKLDVLVDGVAKASTALDDTLDQISLEVETALAAGITVGGQVLYPVYSGGEFRDETLEKPVGVKSMRFSVQFSAMSNAPDTLS